VSHTVVVPRVSAVVPPVLLSLRVCEADRPAAALRGHRGAPKGRRAPFWFIHARMEGTVDAWIETNYNVVA
jgi:hypothetical protein